MATGTPIGKPSPNPAPPSPMTTAHKNHCAVPRNCISLDRTRSADLLMRGENARAVERPHLGGQQALGSRTKTGEHAVAGLRVDEAITAQRLHVDEDVFGALAAGKEAEATRPVEPLDDDDLESADRRRLRPGARQRRRRGITRFRLADRNHLEHLKAALPPRRL